MVTSSGLVPTSAGFWSVVTWYMLSKSVVLLTWITLYKHLDLTRAYSSKNKIVEILGMPIANDLGAKDILENDIEACDDVICNTVKV